MAESLAEAIATSIPGAKVRRRAGVTTILIPGGKCRVCGCTDSDCRKCIARTGHACSWADEKRDLCTACVGRKARHHKGGLRAARGGA